MHAGMGGRPPAWVLYLATAGVLAVTSIFVPTDTAQWLSAAGGALCLVAVTEAVTAEGSATSALRHPWSLIGIGILLMTVGETLHALGAGVPSYADAIALASYPPLIAGLVRLTRARFRESTLDTLLVAAIVPAALGAFAWLPLVEAIQRWVPGADRQAFLASVFLAVDALALAIIARLTVFFRGKPVSYQLLLGAFACSLGAHVSRTVAAITGLVPAPLGSQTLMLLCFGLVAGAALHPSMSWAVRAGRARAVSIGTGHLGLLVVAILLGPVIVIWRFLDRGSWVVLAAAGPAVVSLLVVAHLARLISERQRLEFESSHDGLTGLANRGHFQDRLLLAVQTVAAAPGQPGLGVMFLDLDRFKNVNDSLGHDAGDGLLRVVAQRLLAAARDSDLVARISGDEFAVLLPGVDRAAALAAADRVLHAFDAPFVISGHPVLMTPSIGVAMAPEHGSDVETLLRHADAAMYQAKGGGRRTVRMYDGAMGAQAQRRLALASRLHDAIRGDELVLHYQPRLDLRTGAVLGVEALVRWRHPDFGLIGPAAFLEVAEQADLAAPLGEWVLRAACAEAAGWRAAGHGDLVVSVNVSPAQFRTQDVPAAVRSALSAAGLAPSALELELTERVELDPVAAPRARAALRDLVALGVRCSVDDFGTGHSSIGYLADYPVHAIKLDPSLVARTGASDGAPAPIVRAVIVMAHELGLRVVAEGVETAAQRDYLRRHGCDEAQGFLFSRPLPAGQVGELLARREGAAAGASGGTAAMVAVAVSDWDTETLGGQVWALTRPAGTAGSGAAGAQRAGRHGPSGLDGPEEDRPRRGAVVLGLAAASIAVPFFLGLGAGGGLPPTLQTQVDGAIDAVGASGSGPEAKVARRLADEPAVRRSAGARAAGTSGGTRAGTSPAPAGRDVAEVAASQKLAAPSTPAGRRTPSARATTPSSRAGATPGGGAAPAASGGRSTARTGRPTRAPAPGSAKGATASAKPRPSSRPDKTTETGKAGNTTKPDRPATHSATHPTR